MNPVELLRFDDDTALVESAAAALLREVCSAPIDRPYHLALSGGRIAGRLFFAFTAKARAQGTRLDHLSFYWADERCVPPTHPESNFALVDRALLTPLGIKPQQVHRIRGELLPDLAATEAEAEITRLVPLDRRGQPVLDLVHLGIGEDGHTASLFPDESAELIASKRIYRAVVASKPPPNRVTLTYAALAAVRQVWVVASGPDKQRALERSISEPDSTPLGRLLALRRKTTIFTDVAEHPLG